MTEDVDPAEAVVAQMMRDGGQVWPSEIVAAVRAADHIRAERNRYLGALVELRFLLGHGWEGTGVMALETVIEDAIRVQKEEETAHD